MCLKRICFSLWLNIHIYETGRIKNSQLLWFLFWSLQNQRPNWKTEEYDISSYWLSLVNSQWVYFDTSKHVGGQEKGKLLSFLKIDLLPLSNRCLILCGGTIPAYRGGRDGNGGVTTCDSNSDLCLICVWFLLALDIYKRGAKPLLCCSDYDCMLGWGGGPPKAD